MSSAIVIVSLPRIWAVQYIANQVLFVFKYTALRKWDKTDKAIHLSLLLLDNQPKNKFDINYHSDIYYHEQTRGISIFCATMTFQTLTFET